MDQFSVTHLFLDNLSKDLSKYIPLIGNQSIEALIYKNNYYVITDVLYNPDGSVKSIVAYLATFLKLYSGPIIPLNFLEHQRLTTLNRKLDRFLGLICSINNKKFVLTKKVAFIPLDFSPGVQLSI